VAVKVGSGTAEEPEIAPESRTAEAVRAAAVRAIGVAPFKASIAGAARRAAPAHAAVPAEAAPAAVAPGVEVEAGAGGKLVSGFRVRVLLWSNSPR
jgi:hypothetical protein